MIEIKNLSCIINSEKILDNITLNIEEGSFTAVLGKNGSGKSTLAKHLNGILIPKYGDVIVDGINTKDEENIYSVREKAGMVFQNPESQSVASIVEDDTAFAPENLGLDENEIKKRVDYALEQTGITKLRRRPISTLSGGQKQLTAIAGILAMKPHYMIFDEGTSMLDPAARKKLLDCVIKLKEDFGIAIIWITHYMEEAALSDRIVILKDGTIYGDGTPSEIFSDAELIESAGLTMPVYIKLYNRLKKAGIRLNSIPLSITECAASISKELGELKL